MSGPLFFGLSGLVTALFGFIWMRQRLAPWEGYILSKPTIYFIAIFIFAMFMIQLVSFFLQITNQAALSAGIANTAHLVGLGIGALCGRLNLFAYREGL
jgi:GlpG protein